MKKNEYSAGNFCSLLCAVLLLTFQPLDLFAIQANQLISSIQVQCSVPSEGHRLDTIVVTVTDENALAGISAADFSLNGKAFGWSSSKSDGFKTPTTHDFSAKISALTVKGKELTLFFSNFTEKYFYVDSYTVSCAKNQNLSFTKADVTTEKTLVADDFKKRTHEFTDGSPTLAYNFFTPTDTSEKRPLIVALHGSGDQMNTLANRVAVAWAEPASQKIHPAYVMAPVFADQDPEVLKATVKHIAIVVKQLIIDEKIDPTRIYVTGKSMGGGNTVRIAAENPDLFAAALPLCPSAARYDGIDVSVLKNMPLWFVQATNDKSIPIADTRNTVKKIQAAGSYKIKYTEYTPEQMTARGILPNKYHDVEIIALEDAQYAQWLFAQKKHIVTLIDYIRVNSSVEPRGQVIDTIDMYVTDAQKIKNLKASDFSFTGTAYTWAANPATAYRTDTPHPFSASVSKVQAKGNKITLTIEKFSEKLFYGKEFTVTNSATPELNFTSASVGDTVTAVADTFAHFSANNGAAFDYNLFTPKSNGKKLPLVLALHGSGDQMNLLANKVALAWAAPENQKPRPSYVLAPVFKDQSLDALNAQTEKAIMLIQKLIDLGLVDSSRVYVTGKSMGGMNTNRAYMKYTDMFAAAMPLCGGFPDDVKSLVQTISKKPIYILQGDGDTAGGGTLLPGSRELFKTLQDVGNTQAKYHEFTKAEMDKVAMSYHDIEILVMEDTSFMKWLFSQKKQ